MSIQIASNQQLILGARIGGLQPAIAPDEPITLSQAQALINRNAFKDDARLKAPGNVTITAPGTSIDGVTMATGDRVLLSTQTVPTENGIYSYNGAASAMTRTLDAATFDDLESAIVLVSEGTAAGTRWRQTAINGVLGTNILSFISDAAIVPNATETITGVAQIATQSETDAGVVDGKLITPLKLKNSPFGHKVTRLVIGDGVATSYSIPHTYSTTDVSIEVRENTGTKRAIILENDTPDANTARVIFAGAPALNSYVVLVTKKN